MAPLWVVVGSAATQPLASLGPVHETQYLNQAVNNSVKLILASYNNIKLLLYYHLGFCLLLKALVLAEGKINIIKSCVN